MPTVVVPDLVGLTPYNATHQLDLLGLQVQTQGSGYSAWTGRVDRQRPLAGTIVAVGSTVVLVVSEVTATTAATATTTAAGTFTTTTGALEHNPQTIAGLERIRIEGWPRPGVHLQVGLQQLLGSTVVVAWIKIHNLNAEPFSWAASDFTLSTDGSLAKVMGEPNTPTQGQVAPGAVARPSVSWEAAQATSMKTELAYVSSDAGSLSFGQTSGAEVRPGPDVS